MLGEERGVANIMDTEHFLIVFVAAAWECAVVNISSVQAHRAQPYHSGWTYQASKGAVTIMTKSMALDLSADGIRVNSISPGYIWTELVIHCFFNFLCFFYVGLLLDFGHVFLRFEFDLILQAEKVIMRDRESCEPSVAKRQMSRRYGEPAEVAAAIAFLCSKDASYITGTELAVDGGLLALGPESLGNESSSETH